MTRLERLYTEYGQSLEDRGIAAFHASFQEVLAALAAKTDHLSRY